MPWIKPDFEEISLNMEVTAYVNTDADADQPSREDNREES